jgi:uncharacterized protein (TIGR03084 family)
MLTQAIDYRDECDALHALLADVDAACWSQPTQFKRWTLDDVLGHLHLFDYAARLTLEGPHAFAAFWDSLAHSLATGHSMVDYTRIWLRGCSGPELLRRWHEFSRQVADDYAGLDPARRVKWAGPDMSVRSCISARQMETWAHGQAAFDLLGRVRVEHDRIRNIAIMGVNTFGWTFANRGRAVPPAKPHVRLQSPSGEWWTWHEPDERNRVAGSAVEFCQVVAQTRNIDDTALLVSGEVAHEWMSMAQCFAGPPETPPAPGSRFMQCNSRQP